MFRKIVCERERDLRKMYREEVVLKEREWGIYTTGSPNG
jgi:hypothetical protein